MTELLPSEVGRLILGYLESRGYTKSSKCLLDELPELKEVALQRMRGQRVKLRVGDYSLIDIINDYYNTKEIIHDNIDKYPTTFCDIKRIQCLQDQVEALLKIVIAKHTYPGLQRKIKKVLPSIPENSPLRDTSSTISVSVDEHSLNNQCAGTSQLLFTVSNKAFGNSKLVTSECHPESVDTCGENKTYSREESELQELLLSPDHDLITPIKRKGSVRKKTTPSPKIKTNQSSNPDLDPMSKRLLESLMTDTSIHSKIADHINKHLVQNGPQNEQFNGPSNGSINLFQSQCSSVMYKEQSQSIIDERNYKTSKSSLGLPDNVISNISMEFTNELMPYLGSSCVQPTYSTCSEGQNNEYLTRQTLSTPVPRFSPTNNSSSNSMFNPFTTLGELSANNTSDNISFEHCLQNNYNSQTANQIVGNKESENSASVLSRNNFTTNIENRAENEKESGSNNLNNENSLYGHSSLSSQNAEMSNLTKETTCKEMNEVNSISEKQSNNNIEKENSYNLLNETPDVDKIDNNSMPELGANFKSPLKLCLKNYNREKQYDNRSLLKDTTAIDNTITHSVIPNDQIINYTQSYIPNQCSNVTHSDNYSQDNTVIEPINYSKSSNVIEPVDLSPAKPSNVTGSVSFSPIKPSIFSSAKLANLNEPINLSPSKPSNVTGPINYSPAHLSPAKAIYVSDEQKLPNSVYLSGTPDHSCNYTLAELTPVLPSTTVNTFKGITNTSNNNSSQATSEIDLDGQSITNSQAASPEYITQVKTSSQPVTKIIGMQFIASKDENDGPKSALVQTNLGESVVTQIPSPDKITGNSTVTVIPITQIDPRLPIVLPKPSTQPPKSIDKELKDLKRSVRKHLKPRAKRTKKNICKPVSCEPLAIHPNGPNNVLMSNNEGSGTMLVNSINELGKTYTLPNSVSVSLPSTEELENNNKKVQTRIKRRQTIKKNDKQRKKDETPKNGIKKGTRRRRSKNESKNKLLQVALQIAKHEFNLHDAQVENIQENNCGQVVEESTAHLDHSDNACENESNDQLTKSVKVTEEELTVRLDKSKCIEKILFNKSPKCGQTKAVSIPINVDMENLVDKIENGLIDTENIDKSPKSSSNSPSAVSISLQNISPHMQSLLSFSKSLTLSEIQKKLNNSCDTSPSLVNRRHKGSFSTPRNKAHIRVLDFNTPRKAFSSKKTVKKAKTTLNFQSPSPTSQNGFSLRGIKLQYQGLFASPKKKSYLEIIGEETKNSISPNKGDNSKVANVMDDLALSEESFMDTENSSMTLNLTRDGDKSATKFRLAFGSMQTPGKFDFPVCLEPTTPFQGTIPVNPSLTQKSDLNTPNQSNIDLNTPLQTAFPKTPIGKSPFLKAYPQGPYSDSSDGTYYHPSERSVGESERSVTDADLDELEIALVKIAQKSEKQYGNFSLNKQNLDECETSQKCKLLETVEKSSNKKIDKDTADDKSEINEVFYDKTLNKDNKKIQNKKNKKLINISEQFTDIKNTTRNTRSKKGLKDVERKSDSDNQLIKNDNKIKTGKAKHKPESISEVVNLDAEVKVKKTTMKGKPSKIVSKRNLRSKSSQKVITSSSTNKSNIDAEPDKDIKQHSKNETNVLDSQNNITELPGLKIEHIKSIGPPKESLKKNYSSDNALPPINESLIKGILQNEFSERNAEENNDEEFTNSGSSDKIAFSNWGKTITKSKLSLEESQHSSPDSLKQVWSGLKNSTMSKELNIASKGNKNSKKNMSKNPKKDASTEIVIPNKHPSKKSRTRKQIKPREKKTTNLKSKVNTSSGSLLEGNTTTVEEYLEIERQLEEMDGKVYNSPAIRESLRTSNVELNLSTIFTPTTNNQNDSQIVDSESTPVKRVKLCSNDSNLFSKSSKMSFTPLPKQTPEKQVEEICKSFVKDKIGLVAFPTSGENMSAEMDSSNSLQDVNMESQTIKKFPNSLEDKVESTKQISQSMNDRIKLIDEIKLNTDISEEKINLSTSNDELSDSDEHEFKLTTSPLLTLMELNLTKPVSQKLENQNNNQSLEKKIVSDNNKVACLKNPKKRKHSPDKSKTKKITDKFKRHNSGNQNLQMEFRNNMKSATSLLFSNDDNSSVMPPTPGKYLDITNDEHSTLQNENVSYQRTNDEHCSRPNVEHPWNTLAKHPSNEIARHITGANIEHPNKILSGKSSNSRIADTNSLFNGHYTENVSEKSLAVGPKKSCEVPSRRSQRQRKMKKPGGVNEETKDVQSIVKNLKKSDIDDILGKLHPT